MPPETPATHGDEPMAPPSAPDAGARPSFKKRLLGAGAWTAGGMMLGHVLRLGGNLIVTRLLVPEMFGVMAVVLTIAVALQLLSDVGLHQSVIRHPRGNERVFLDTVWSVQIVRGFVIFAVTLLIALALYVANANGWIPAVSTYAKPELPWVLAVSGLAPVIGGFHSTNVHTAVRELSIRKYTLLELTQQIVTIAVMVLLAWQTGSIWSIVAANLVGSLTHTLLSHVIWRGPRNRWAWDRGVLVDLQSFGKWLLLSSVIGVFALNADRLILAGAVDATTMGLYSVAFGLASALTMVLDKVYASVLLPAFSEVMRTEPHRLAEVYVRGRKKFDPFVLMASGAVFALSGLVISLLYDARYADAGSMLAILSLAMIVTRYQLTNALFLAIDKPAYHAMLNVVRATSNFTLIPLGLAVGGLQGGLIAIALRELPTVPLILWLAGKHGLNRWGLELALLVFWPIGWVIGWCVLQVAHAAGLGR